MKYLISILLFILGISIAYAESRIVTFESMFELTNSQKVIEAKKAASELCNTPRITVHESLQNDEFERKVVETQSAKVSVKEVLEKQTEMTWVYTATVDLKCS